MIRCREQKQYNFSLNKKKKISIEINFSLIQVLLTKVLHLYYIIRLGLP